VAILSNAGGPGILCADACEGAKLAVPEVTAATRRRLAAPLPQAASLGNPIDRGAAATADDYRLALPLLLDDAHIDSVIALFVSAGMVDMDAVGAALKEGRSAASTARRKPLLTCFLGQRGVPASLRGPDESVPSYRFPESAARALACAARRAAWLDEPPGTVPQFADVDVAGARALVERALAERGPGWLTPAENEALLAIYGIPHLTSVTAASADQAVAAAVAMGLPVALKLASTTLVHKSDWNGVHLDLRTPEAVRAATQEIDAVLERRGRVAERLGYLVQPMAKDGVDTLVGLVVDPDFGPLVAFGLGGVAMELVGDVAFRLAPLSDRDAERMVRPIKSAPLLAGFRGAPPADEPALIDVLLRVAHLALTVPELLELDLNPVRVYPAGQGACALDARVRVAT
jgi:acyl-CoA synthetase (NDP forming)